MSQTTQKKKLIYIMGCGRSGTTIMDFVLGNGENCLDLGEVTDFLKKDGQPNGFGPETENGRFWASVTKKMVADMGSIFNDPLKSQLIKIEHPKGFIPLYLGLANKKTLDSYQCHINNLYQTIATEAATHTCFIDSSKYPGRALLLSTLLTDFDVKIIHFVRHPVMVIESFGDKTKKQGYKGFFSANVYYFLINLFCFLVKCRIGKKEYTKIRYEDLLTQPENILATLSQRFNINLDNPIKIISENKALKRGFIFNGNRMRMKDKIILKRQDFYPPHTLKGFFTMIINWVWY